jgi:hypothetical protein
MRVVITKYESLDNWYFDQIDRIFHIKCDEYNRPLLCSSKTKPGTLLYELTSEEQQLGRYRIYIDNCILLEDK